MKAIIEINMGNAAFGNNDSERLFELRMVTEKLIDNATHIMAANVGDMATAQDSNGNTVAKMNIVEDTTDAARYYFKESLKNERLLARVTWIRKEN